MPKKAEAALKREARKKGLEPGSDAYKKYVYGGLRKTGWKPKRTGSKERKKS